MSKRLAVILWFLIATFAFGQGQDSIRAVGGVLTINLVPSSNRYKVFVDQTITSTVITNPIDRAVITVLFVQDSTGHSVAFGGNISSGCIVQSAANLTSSCQFTFDAANNQWTTIGGGGVAANSPLPAATSGPGPVFNVKNYKAPGDTRMSQNCSLSNFVLTCTDLTFTSADVTKHVSCATGSPPTAMVNGATTITAFNSATTVTLSANFNSGGASCIIGTPDDTAVAAAFAAAQAAMVNIFSQGNVNASSGSAPTLYFPAGDYNLFNTGMAIVNSGSANSGFKIIGDGPDQSRIYWHTGANPAGASGIACNNVTNFILEGITLDGGNGAQNFGNSVLTSACASTVLRDVKFQRFSLTGSGATVSLGQSTYGWNVNSTSNQSIGLSSTGGGEFYASLISNNAPYNIQVSNVFGMPTGTGFRWMNSLVDECGTAPCVRVQNSSDVWFIGSALFTGMSVDGTSVAHIEGGSMGPFNSDSNLSGLAISTGGMVTASDARFVASGTGKCISNSGIFRDNGGNSCESIYIVTSGASSGTTATLTATSFTANINTNCAVGDSIQVYNNSVTGYNGYFPGAVTAVGTNTIAYTTPGSNLGASTGGFASCRGMTTYSGTLPVELLNNPVPNTCYITGTFAATVTGAPMCNFRTQSTTNITFISAASTTVTACTVAPVVTLSDGTNSQTLTITTAKSQWASNVDASTGVGSTIFKNNGTIQVTNTVGTCTTPPTNFSVTFNVSPILSN